MEISIWVLPGELPSSVCGLISTRALVVAFVLAIGRPFACKELYREKMHESIPSDALHYIASIMDEVLMFCCPVRGGAP